MAEIDLGSRQPPRWPTAAPTGAGIDRDGSIVVHYPDRPRRLHRIWARDSCPCHECRITQTAEHRWFLGRVDGPPAPVAVVLDGPDVLIDWDDGHHSRFTPAWLIELVGQARRQPLAAVTWDGSTTIESFGRDAVLADPAVQLALCNAFERAGVVLVTGLGTGSGESARFIESLGAPLRELPFGRIHDVFVDPSGYNVAHTAEQVPPHNDFPSYAWPPSGQALHMMVNQTGGGESIVVDAFHVLGLLSTDQLDVLARVPVGFRQFSSDVETWARQPLVRLDWTGRVVGLRFSNQLMQPFDPEHPDLDAFYDAYGALARAVCDQANQARLRLEAGQMLMVHGHRVLHARTAFDRNGPRHLQDVYFEADDVFSRGSVLRGDRPDAAIDERAAP